ncbi:MAG: glycosyltransferase [Gemmataceae bacterium]
MVNSTIRKRKPTVCQVLHGLWVGGAEVLAARLARQLRDHYHFVFVCLDELGSLGKELQREGFRVEVLERGQGLDWRCPVRLAKILRHERVDLLHAHQYTPFFYSMMGRLLCSRPAVMFTEHGRHQPDYPRPKRIFANRLLLTRRDRVVSVGEAVRQALVDNEGIPSDRISVIYNGVDLQAFADNRVHREAVQAELGIKPTDFTIFQVARLDYLKDHLTAIRTFERVVLARPDSWLVLVGEGPEFPKIQSLVEEKNLAERVQFLGLREDVPRLLASADLFLLTSISEGIPLTLIEAMAAKVPIVSTNVGGVPEVIEDGKTGMLVPSGEDHLLARKILELASDGYRRRQIAQCGFERALAFFSETQMHSSYLQLYEEMLRG